MGEIFLSHLVKGTTEESVKAFLNEKGYENIKCNKTSKDESHFDSFRIKLKDEHCVFMISPEAEDFWPSNVMCRRFYRKKNHGGSLPTTNGLQSD